MPSFTNIKGKVRRLAHRSASSSRAPSPLPTLVQNSSRAQVQQAISDPADSQTLPPPNNTALPTSLQTQSPSPTGKAGSSNASIVQSPPQRKPQNAAFNAACEKVAQSLTQKERETFMAYYKDKSAEETYESVKILDDMDSSTYARRGISSLGPVLGVLDTCITSISICINQSPEISSLVVGGVRFLIDIIAKYVKFYSRLSEMIAKLVDYFKVFEYCSRAVDDKSIIYIPLVEVYCNFLLFCKEARLVPHKKRHEADYLTVLSHLRSFVRVQWQPFEERFGGIELDFQHHVKVLQLATQGQILSTTNDHFAATIGGFAAVEKEWKQIHSKEQTEERRKFLEWISDVNYEQDFEANLGKRHLETGKWLLEDPKLRSWIAELSSHLLWCFGKPGAGKSVLASLVLDDLSQYELNDPATCVIFAYYSYNHPERHSLTSLLGSFIKQLCSKLNELPKSTLVFFSSNHGNGKLAAAASSIDMKNQFLELVRQFQKVFVVIDGLDECQTEPLEMRVEVLDFIVSLAQTKPVWTFVTSRRDEDIKDAFERCSAIQIDSELSNSDIKTFLRDEIIARIEGRSKPKLILKDSNLKNHILEVLSSKADGMFLWAKLQLDSICRHRHDRDIRKELECLPRGLDETYGRILERIMQQPLALQELARKALMWTIYGVRPLYVDELREALAIDATNTKHEDILSGMYDEETIITSTGNFFVDTTSSAYSKAHPELSAFFIGPESANAQLAISCLTYLHLDIFEKGPYSDIFHLRGGVKTSRFALYASYFFDEHLKRLHSIPEDVLTKVEALLIRNPKNIAAILQLRRFKGNLTEDHTEQFDKFRMPVNGTTLVLSTALYDMLEINGPSNDWMQTPLPRYTLHQASYYGLSTAVSHLLDSHPGIDVNERDESNMTPLHYAVRNGHLDVLKVLLNHSADVESIIQDEYGQTTALMTACHQRHLTIAEMLLEYNAQVNFHGGKTGNALLSASKTGNISIVKLLLEHGADVNLHGGLSGTAPERASRAGHIAVVEVPLQHKADVNLQEKGRSTALEAACQGGHLDVVKSLIIAGADISERAIVNACNYYCKDDEVLDLLLERGGTATSEALEEAAKYGWLKRCYKLLDHGVSITPLAVSNACGYCCKDDGVLDLLLERGGTATSEALEEAAKYGWLKRCYKLLDHGVSITPEAVSNACGSYCKDGGVLDLLLERGGIALSKALEEAAKYGWLERCQKLLDHGVSITLDAVSNACGYFCKDDGVLDLLLERGGIAPSKALEEAAEYGLLKRCQKLLDHSVSITPLVVSNACGSYCKDNGVLDLLLERGGTATSEALEKAAKYGWLERCQRLLDHGVSITPEAVSNACGYFCKDDGVLDLLLARGGTATSKVLEKACRYGKYDHYEKLLHAGAPITSKAIAYACCKGKSGQIAQILHTRGEGAGLTAEMLASAERKYNRWLGAAGDYLELIDDSEDEGEEEEEDESEEDSKDDTGIEIE